VRKEQKTEGVVDEPVKEIGRCAFSSDNARVFPQRIKMIEIHIYDDMIQARRRGEGGTREGVAYRSLDELLEW
jgi:hypothetical protein